MLMDKTLMVLGASILQLPAIEKASEMGLKVVVLDMNPNAIGFNVPGVVREVVSTLDIPAAIEVAKKYEIDGVMTLATDMPMRTVSAVASECKLNGISMDTAKKATDKSLMRKALGEADVPIPISYSVSNITDFNATISKIGFPIIVKPADSSGSRGITRIDKLDDNTDEAFYYAKSNSKSGSVLVEECMIGPEVSVETLAVDGEVYVIQITDKMTTGNPHYVEIGHTQPTRLDCSEDIARIAIAANKAIGIQNGPSHTEIIVTAEGPKIVEIGARLGGDCITTHLVPLSTGVDMVEATILISLGIKPNIENKYSKGAAIRYFNQRAGIIKDIRGLEDAYASQGVKQISVVHGVGETITDIVDSASRMGFVIADGANAGEAANNCVLALNKILIEEI